MIRYDMDSNLRVTFAAKEGLAAKSVCKVCGSGTVGPCSDGDDFCGVADTVRGGRCGVVLRGFVTVPYSLPAPALGYVGVAADSTGGIKELHESLLKGASWHKPDHHFLLLDFPSYQEARLRAYADYKNDPDGFARKCLRNVAGAGKFSADRSVKEYAENIWKV